MFVTPILASLHWLPIQARADFKVLLSTFKALHGLAPPYITKPITPYTPARPLRSLDAGLLVIPLVKKSWLKSWFAYLPLFFGKTVR